MYKPMEVAISHHDPQYKPIIILTCLLAQACWELEKYSPGVQLSGLWLGSGIAPSNINCSNRSYISDDPKWRPPESTWKNWPSALPLRMKPEKVLSGQNHMSCPDRGPPGTSGETRHKKCLMVKLRLSLKQVCIVSNAPMSTQRTMTSPPHQRHRKASVGRIIQTSALSRMA